MNQKVPTAAEIEQLLTRAQRPNAEALRLHPFYQGKIETGIKCRIRDVDDFAYWYSPGVAAPCREIAADPLAAHRHTNRGNTVAVVSDGTRVLGLGDIGPLAGLPVMEGKALLFKYLGGVDAFPIMLDTKDPERLIETVLLLQPSFGGVNLEDIAQPKCFRVLEELQARAEIPVWHDDQQGTATVILAGLLNALRVTGRSIESARIVFVGSGASNTVAARLAFGRGANPAHCMMVDSKGLLHRDRKDIAAVRDQFKSKWRLCETTNAEGRTGDIAAALRGADVVVAAATPGPGVIKPEWIQTMAPHPIVFACANPVPEIWPWEAQAGGAAVFATGRSDFPNQVNNSLIFPGLFRGTLDVQARAINDAMCFAAAEALAAHVGDRLAPDCLLPTMADPTVGAAVAAAVGRQAQLEGLARLAIPEETLRVQALERIARAQNLTRTLMDSGLIAAAPGE